MTRPSGELSPTEVRILSALRDQKEIDGPGWGLGNPLYFRQTTDLEKGEVEYALQKLVEKGYITRVNRGLYCINTDEETVFEADRPTPETGVRPQLIKSSGHEPTQVYTPARIARFLTDWAVRQEGTSVLEPTVGSGNIAKQICRRKFDLGANPEIVETTVFGREVDENAVNKLQERIHREFEISLPGISAGDIFAYDGPMVEAIVGNPPYAGASNFSLPDGVKSQLTEKYGFNGNTDLYCYVTAHVTQYLESGGRLAVVLSNSWLRKRYGTEFKQFLFSEYDIRAIIGFEHTTFDAGTNPVCLLAERSEGSSGDSQEIEFIQLRDEPELVGAETIDELRKQTMLPSVESPVNPDDNFDELLRAPELVEYIRTDSLFTELETVADVRIGLQTLAKEFYTFDPGRESSSSPSLAEKYKQPFAHSPSNFESPRINGDNADRKLLDIDEADVANQNSAAEYIEWGENREVGQRNTDETFAGYNEKPRIKGANRDPWYDLSDEKTKCTGPILLPRRIYKAYTAYWNQNQIVGNENFLIVTPNDTSTTKSLLAFLNSTLGEVCVRLSGQVYGGGVCELSVTGAKSIACPEFDHLNSDAHELLSKSFNTFLDTQNREELDQTVYETLGLPESVRSLIEVTAAESLREVAVK